MATMPMAERLHVASLADVMTNPVLLEHLSLETLIQIRRELRRLDADLEAGILRLVAQGGGHQRGQEPEPDQLLAPEVAAARFGVTKRWLLEHASEIPGVKRLSRKTVRFSERRLARFLEKVTP